MKCLLQNKVELSKLAMLTYMTTGHAHSSHSQIVKAWDVFNGAKMFEFSCDLGEGVGVSALDVDKAGKRYCVLVHYIYMYITKRPYTV